MKWYDYRTSESLHLQCKLNSVNVNMATYAKKILYKMQNLYLPQPGVEEAPFEKLSPDFQIVNPSINIKSDSICKYIADVIFMPDSQRKPILKTIPNDINFYPLKT